MYAKMTHKNKEMKNVLFEVVIVLFEVWRLPRVSGTSSMEAWG
jgi:hypothetical protein